MRRQVPKHLLMQSLGDRRIRSSNCGSSPPYCFDFTPIVASFRTGKGALVGRVFLRDRLVVVAAPTFRRPGSGAVRAEVRGSDRSDHWPLARSAGNSNLSVEPVLRLSSLVTIRNAVRAGAGVSRLPVSLVAGDLATGRLVKWGEVEGSDVAL